MAKKQTQTTVSVSRVISTMRNRMNPVRGLTPTKLASIMQAFDVGDLAQASDVWQKIRDRDDQVKTVSEKRDLAAALLDWEILTIDDSPEAEKHKEALEYFYENLVATHVEDLDRRGGVSALIRQMMHAVGHKYAVFEIVWKPAPGATTAEFRFVPLSYCERRTGRIRYRPTEFAYEGIDLEEGGWMVVTGPGLMEATAIAYLIKSGALKDWFIFSEKAGMPGIHGKTDAAQGSKEFEDFADAVRNFGHEWSLVTNSNGVITPIDLKTGSVLPYPDLLDRMDRAIARLWRGADLGTMSAKGDAVGSNPQDAETAILEAADALMISVALNWYVDRQVIKQRFGVEPLAYFKLQPKARTNVGLQLKIDEYLIKWGVPRAKNEILERYGRPVPDKGEELATPGAAPALGLQQEALQNEQAGKSGRRMLFVQEAAAQIDPAVEAVIRPIVDRIKTIAGIEDADIRTAAILDLKRDLPGLYKRAIAQIPAAATAFEQVIGSAFASGFAESAQTTPSLAQK